MLALKNDLLEISLPQGKDQGQLIADLEVELQEIENKLYGLNLKITGRITTGMALFLGHKLAHVCKSVSIFDPKENKFFKAVWH